MNDRCGTYVDLAYCFAIFWIKAFPIFSQSTEDDEYIVWVHVILMGSGQEKKVHDQENLEYFS